MDLIIRDCTIVDKCKTWIDWAQQLRNRNENNIKWQISVPKMLKQSILQKEARRKQQQKTRITWEQNFKEKKKLEKRKTQYVKLKKLSNVNSNEIAKHGVKRCWQERKNKRIETMLKDITVEITKTINKNCRMHEEIQEQKQTNNQEQNVRVNIDRNKRHWEEK